MRVELEDGAVLTVTVSIGLAAMQEGERGGSKGARELMAEADRALYRAKAEGRNRIEPALAVTVS